MGAAEEQARVLEFCAAIRARSAEHAEAVRLLGRQQATAGVVVGILRQELDSMVRAIFLLSGESRSGPVFWTTTPRANGGPRRPSAADTVP
jgi:hypothetical protein